MQCVRTAPVVLLLALLCINSATAISWSGIRDLLLPSGDDYDDDDHSRQHHSGHHGGHHGGGSECDDPKYGRGALKLIKELPFSGLFRDTKGQTKFEGSGMVEYKDKYLVVFDSLMSLGLVNDRFQFRDPENVMVGEPGPESQFEGVTMMEDGHVLLLMESVDHPDGYKPETLEVQINDDLSGYEVLRRCVVDYTLSYQNKGFEGMAYHKDAEGVQYLIGLCEGNHCSGGSKGRERGEGRIVITRLDTNSTQVSSLKGDEHEHDCTWTPIKKIPIPRTASFMDYSEISFKGNKVAITSQEDSALWIGEFDFDKFEFVGEGEVYYFPRNAACQQVYCNVEGVAFVDDTRFIVTSDRAKKYQPHECNAKDQSVHVFSLPPN